MVSKILLGYGEALWPKKLEISHASQILTNHLQILVLSSSYLITTVPVKNIFKKLFNFSGYLSMMDDTGATRDDLKVPDGEVGDECNAATEDGRDIMVSYL